MPVLSMKFKIPEPRKNYVSRKKLMNKLQLIRKKKVTIIKGGAGSGKTTLVSGFIKENKLSEVKWITLDNNMNQVFIFWKYILEGTKDYLGDLNEDFRNWFDSNIQKDNLWQILSMYINKMCQEKDIVLILDDFQIVEDEFLISTIDFLIENLPDNLHLVLITRVLPGINLGTITMEDKLLLIDENEIRMSEEESREFLLHTLALEHNEALIQGLIGNSNGWVGGLQLMAVAAKEQSQTVIPSINTVERVIGDYISKEIYNYLSEDEKEFLKKTSILGYFNQRICEQFISQYDFNQIMGAILKKNLFVVSLDEKEKVYRYHSIFKDYLAGLLDKDKKQKEELHCLAADIYYDLGDFDECLYHLFSINAYEKIMKLLLKMPQTSTTFTYMTKVPLEQIINNTDFAYQYFFNHYASMEMEACEKIYHFILENMTEDETFAAFKHANLFFDSNWEFKNLAVIPLNKIEAMPLNPVTKAYLLIKEAYFLYLEDQSAEAYRYLELAQGLYEKTGNLYIEMFILAEEAQILEDDGELKKALNIYKKMEELLEHLPTMRACYLIGIAGVYLRMLALVKAREALDEAMACVKENVVNIKSAYLYTLAEYLYVTGEHEQTEQIITDLASREVYQNIFFSARLLRYPIYRGKHKELAVKFALDYEKAESILKNLDTELLYAGILYENSNEVMAFSLIDEIIAKARKTQNKLKIVEGALLKIRFLLKQDNTIREVLNLFIEAVAYAYENLIALPFWFERETISLLFNSYQIELINTLSKEEQQFIQKILEINDKTGIELESKRKYDLTEREIEVLEEMKQGHSNKQIAENLCISLATVKSHIINIYGKLGVNNRVAAINLFAR